MTTIKQRIRMFAQWATAVGDIPSTQSLKSIAQPDHKSWLVTVDNFFNMDQRLKVNVTNIDDGNYCIVGPNDTILWQGMPSDTNFNLAMQASLKRLIEE